VKVKNSTVYRTAALRRFLRAGIVANGLDPKGYRVHVVPSRHGQHWGCAYLNSSWVKLSVPKGKLDLAQLARVFDHELAHNRGLNHVDMDVDTLWCKGPAPEWSTSFSVEEFEPTPAEPPIPVDPAARAAVLAFKRAKMVERREARAREALARWERKKKSAERLVAKYRRVVRGYEQRAAARPKVES